MRLTVTTLMVALLAASGAYAELQNVEVGGSIRIRGNMYSMDDAVTFTDV